MEQIKNIRLY